MTTTNKPEKIKPVSPRDRLAGLLDVLEWAAEDRLYSLAASDAADIWLAREGGDVCVTARVLPVASTGTIRRVRAGFRWELTDDGHTVRNTALAATAVAS